jgi:hypothetical protein
LSSQPASLVTPSTGAGWHHRLRREIAWLFVAKLCALMVLWALFFSPAHRTRADAPAMADQLAVASPAVSPPSFVSPSALSSPSRAPPSARPCEAVRCD